ncbi:hypothetical protein [Paraburkholderia sp. BCC1886]|uniref:hypothetical protein n=1 Tax=Paraburkholderia sp. BCC1886 TaxID=2562670 RepID=UPI001183C58B|nr:hypothetical protein [Paraburkholderia sp. BCC1886]
MPSLLKVALEGDSAEPFASTSSDATDKDMVELKGPLADVFTQVLAKEYARADPAAAPATEGVATESQANDALAVSELMDNIQLANDTTPAGDGALTVYGVAAADVKPEHIVEVSQDLANRDADDMEDFILVMDATQPSVNSPESSNAEPRFEKLGEALESLVDAYGGHVFHSLEGFAKAYLEDKRAGQGKE